MKLSNLKVNDLALTLVYAWENYNELMRGYMYFCLKTPIEQSNVPVDQYADYWRHQYKHWVRASESFQKYTQAIRNFSNCTNWNATIEVEYAEIVGIAIPDVHSLVFLNAFPGRDDEVALCRYGADKKFLMRIGGLPEGTMLFARKASYQIDANGQPFYIHPKPYTGD